MQTSTTRWQTDKCTSGTRGKHHMSEEPLDSCNPKSCLTLASSYTRWPGKLNANLEVATAPCPMLPDCAQIGLGRLGGWSHQMSIYADELEQMVARTSERMSSSATWHVQASVCKAGGKTFHQAHRFASPCQRWHHQQFLVLRIQCAMKCLQAQHLYLLASL